MKAKIYNGCENREESLYRKEMSRKRHMIERRREVRKHIALILIGIVLVIGISLSYHVIRSQANSEIGEVQYKYYKSVVLAYGDTLWSVAEEYADVHYEDAEDYINEVMKINHLKSEDVDAGQYLIVPYYSKEFIGATAKR